MDLSVVIVSYNTRELLRSCLQSIFAETRVSSFEVWVIDNASKDGSADMIRKDFQKARLIALETNIGFARACNLAARESSGEYIVLLNPDTVIRDHALDRLLDFGRSHPKAGICGGRTLRPDGTVDPSSCWGQQTLWSLFCYAAGFSTVFRSSAIFDPESLGRWQRDSVRSVGVVTGCLLLAPRKLWDQLEGFDERFFMYGEDADLTMRAAAAGYNPMITPAATITHLVGASSSTPAKKRQMSLSGRITLLNKHWSPGSARFGRALLMAGVWLRSVGARLTGKGVVWIEVWKQRQRWKHGWLSSGGD